MRVTLLFMVLLTGCASGEDDGADTDATDTDVTGACEALSGRTFASLEELECGLTPDGVQLCHWQLTFSADGSFTWRYSDVGESGTWACDAGEITGDGAAASPYSGSYDPRTDTLTWDGHDYR